MNVEFGTKLSSSFIKFCNAIVASFLLRFSLEYHLLFRFVVLWQELFLADYFSTPEKFIIKKIPVAYHFPRSMKYDFPLMQMENCNFNFVFLQVIFGCNPKPSSPNIVSFGRKLGGSLV